MNRVCQWCGAQFAAKPSQVRLRNGGKYCSNPCKHKAQGAAMRGAGHPGWKGDDVNDAVGRDRALRMYDVTLCERCGASRNLDRHHRDGNTRNNASENVEVLCRSCHMRVDGRAARFSAATNLSPEVVMEIRRRYEALPRAGSRCKRGVVSALAAELGVSVKTINNVGSGRRAR